MIALSSQVFSLNGSSSLLNFSSFVMSSGFRSLHFWLCPSGLNKPQTGHWKTGVYDSRNALESASALRTLAQYARPILLVSSLKASNLSKPSCIFPVYEIQANAPPKLLPGWCGVVIYDSRLGLLFCFDEHSENGRIYGHASTPCYGGEALFKLLADPSAITKTRL